MTEYENIRVETEGEGRIAVLTLDRPHYRNALSRVLVEELDAAFVEATEDPDVRVIILRGEGESFCAGHDIGTPEELADREARGDVRDLKGRFASSWRLDMEKMLRWRNLPKPTIAVVHGHCIFAGWMLASSMDLIFAAEDAQFLGTYFPFFTVPWDLGIRQSKELLFENRFMSGAEAVERGLANRAYPADRLMEETLRYASRVAESDPFNLRMIKLAINQAQDAQGYELNVRGSAAGYFVMASEPNRREPGSREHRVVGAAAPAPPAD